MLKILKLFYMYTRGEQISKCIKWESGLLLSEKKGTNNQGLRARINPVLLYSWR